jgi:DNA-binding FadR family transcriptional regulator
MTNASESFALFLKQNRIDPKHLIEFRESIDHAITDLAIARAGHDEKAALLAGTEALNSFLGLDEPDMEALIEQDRGLNIQFARMSHNPLFEWIMQALQIGFSSHDYGLYANPDFREMTIHNWHHTAKEIAANEPGKAHGYIGYHYVMLREALEAKDSTPLQAPDSDFWKDDDPSSETDAA